MGFEPPKPADTARDASHDAFGEDVVDHPRVHPTGLTPVGSPVHEQHAEIADRLASDEVEEEDFDEPAEPFEAEAEEVPASVVDEPVSVPAPVAIPLPLPCRRRAVHRECVWRQEARARQLSRCGSIPTGTSSCVSPVRSMVVPPNKS